MSALSDYFHKTSKGYASETSWGDSATALEMQHQLNNERIANIKTPENISELQKRLTIDNNEKDAEQAKEIEKRRITMLNAVAQSMGPDLEERILKNFEARGSSNNQTAEKKSEVSYSYEDIEQLRIIRNKIYASVNRINKTPESNHTKAIETLIGLYNQFYSIAKRIDSSIKDLQFSASNVTKESTRQAILDIYNKFTIGTVNANLKGEFGEKLVLAAGDKLYGAGMEALSQVMKEGLDKIEGSLGQSRGNITIRADYYPEAVYNEWKTSSSVEQTDEYGTYYNFAATQDKVDATITVNNEKINASVKAYSANSAGTAYPHLQDVNFAYSLAKSAENFGNHYIQLLLLNRSTKKFEEAHKSELAYEALVHGNLLKESAVNADTFVFIDLNSGKVRTMSTKSMLENYLEKFKFSYSTDFGKVLRKSNYWVSSKGIGAEEAARKRVVSLYNALRMLKISVAYTMKVE